MRPGKANFLRFCPLIGLILMGGCAGYRLGPTNGIPALSRSIQVNTFQNSTFEPRASEAFAFSLRRNLQQDGTYKLATHNDGDIIVTGAIVDVQRSALSFQPADILTARDYYISMTAKVHAYERSTGRVILDGNVVGHTTVRAGSDLVAAERQALPLMAEDLARNVTSRLVDGSW